MMRFVSAAVLCLMIGACTDFMGASGPTKDESWIRSRVLGGVDMDIDPAAIPGRLAELGYETYSRTCSEGGCDRLFMAKGILKDAQEGELCAPAGQRIELSIIVQNGRAWRMDCMSDGARTLPDYTQRFVGRANSHKNSTTYVYSVDHVFKSYRWLIGCPAPGGFADVTAEEAEQCVGYRPSAGPYIYSTVFPTAYTFQMIMLPSGDLVKSPDQSESNRFPSGKMTHVFMINSNTEASPDHATS